MPKPKGPSRSFQRAPRRLAWALGAGVDAVDDDAAELVDDQVHRSRLTGDQRGRGLGRVERDPEGPREVVAGAERDQPQRALGELVAAVQGGDDGVQAAVAARDDDRPAPGPVQHAVELAGVARGRHLDVGVLAQHAERDVERVSLRRRRRRRW